MTVVHPLTTPGHAGPHGGQRDAAAEHATGDATDETPPTSAAPHHRSTRFRRYRRRWRIWLPYVVSAAVFLALIMRFGIGPFIDAVRTVPPAVIAVAVVVTALATVCNALRWRAVSAALGTHIPLRAAVVAYYRSQFVNSVLPGGIVGDVERGLRTPGPEPDTDANVCPGADAHSDALPPARAGARRADDAQYRRPSPPSPARGLRAVAWERMLGQLVQIVAAVALLALAPTPLRTVFAPVAILVLAAGTVAVLVYSGAACITARRRSHLPAPHLAEPDAAAATSAHVISGPTTHGYAVCGATPATPPAALPIPTCTTVPSRTTAAPTHRRTALAFLTRTAQSIRRVIGSDLRALAHNPGATAIVVTTSLIATAGYVLVFALAASTVGVRVAPVALVPVILAVLVVGALPLNVAGWGPREGAAAALFVLVGVPAAQGLAASVLFGVLMLIGVLPGAVTLVAPRARAARHG